jgi:Ca2+/Na+ antiporter
MIQRIPTKRSISSSLCFALDIGLVVLGLALLIAGGEALVRGASTLAVRVGISPAGHWTRRSLSGNICSRARRHGGSSAGG